MILTNKHERHIYSQYGEDGILFAILDEIGETTKTFIEIAVDDGLECNCRALREHRGFTGIMIDQGHENEFIHKRFITAENVQSVLKELNAPIHPDVFSLDIDGVDWYVLRNLGPFLPRVLVCEFNAHFGPNLSASIPYKRDFAFCGTRFHGASSLAMHLLANRLGMALVYSTCLNMFFVERSLAHHFDNADDPKIRYQGSWSHPEDGRMYLVIDPFTVECPEPA